MAGEWIKWSKGLPNKPEVVRLAGALGLSRAEVVVRLMTFWEWCDGNIPEDAICEDGSAFVTLSPQRGDNVAFVDALVGTPKFADSLALVNWIRFRDGRVELPNFGRHNGETAKTRARNAKNQKHKRQQRGSETPPVPLPVVTKVSPEMSPPRGDIVVTRGEENRDLKPPPIPPAEPGGGGGAAPTQTREPKPKRPKKPAPDEHPLFARFWAAYPRKVAKPDAAHAFGKIDPDEALLVRMVTAVGRHARSEQWLKDGGNYIPYPASWLNGRRWEDEPPASGPPEANGFRPVVLFGTQTKESKT